MASSSLLVVLTALLILFERVESLRIGNSATPKTLRTPMSLSGSMYYGDGPYQGPDSTPLLDTVSSPADLKKFNLKQLKDLAYELRWETLSAVSKVRIKHIPRESSLHAVIRRWVDTSAHRWVLSS